MVVSMKKAVLSLAVASVLAGCSSVDKKSAFEHEEPGKKSPALQEAESQADILRKGAILEDTTSPFLVIDYDWVAGDVREAYEEFPPHLYRNIVLSMSDRTLPEISERIYETTGIGVFLASDLMAEPKRDGKGAFTLSNDATGAAIPSQIGGNEGKKSVGMTGASNPFVTPISFRHQGTMVGLLNLLSNRYQINWRYDKEQERIVFYRLQTKTFQIRFAGKSDSRISTGSSGSSELSQQQTTLEFSTGGWNQIKESIESFLSPYGSASSLESSGAVTVTDTPGNLAKITEFVRDLNNDLSSQVAIEVKVFSVRLNDSKSAGIDWSNLASVMSSGDSVIVNGVTSPVSGTPGSITYRSNGALTGDLLIKALSSQGDVEVVTTSRHRGLSMQPIPVKVVSEVAYISGQTDVESGTTTALPRSTVETDKIDVGFSMTMIPRVYDQRTLALQLTMELSELVELRTYQNSSIETPIVDRKITTQRAMLNSGETMVLSGFEQTSKTSSKSGTIDKDFWLFGGGKESKNERSVLVVMITPVVTSWQTR